MKKPRINYPALRAGDIFFSSADNPIGNLIRWNQVGFARRRDLDIPNHAGVITEAHGQKFATEMGPFGLAENSLEKYRKPKNRIVGVLRWDLFESLTARERAMQILALQRRKEKEYSWFGAIKSIPLWRRVFRRVKVKERLDFCSENAFYLLRELGITGYPALWDNHPPHPLALYKWLRSRVDFVEVEDVYIKENTAPRYP